MNLELRWRPESPINPDFASHSPGAPGVHCDIQVFCVGAWIQTQILMLGPYPLSYLSSSYLFSRLCGGSCLFLFLFLNSAVSMSLFLDEGHHFGL